MERIDDLHIKGYKIVQDDASFCFGMDAVLLSDYAEIKKNDLVLDLGTGTGIIPILLAAKNKGKHYIGVEIQSEFVKMARKSVKMNNLSGKVRIVEGDFNIADRVYVPSSFDVVTTNPPYIKDGDGLKNEKDSMLIARHEVRCNLDNVCRVAARLLKVRGRFYIVHRPNRIVDLLTTLRKYQLEPKRMRLVYPYVNKEANLVLVEAIRMGKPFLHIEKPLVVYRKENVYSKEIEKIYNMDEEFESEEE